VFVSDNVIYIFSPYRSSVLIEVYRSYGARKIIEVFASFFHIPFLLFFLGIMYFLSGNVSWVPLQVDSGIRYRYSIPNAD
jgi:hypothetical protein